MHNIRKNSPPILLRAAMLVGTLLSVAVGLFALTQVASAHNVTVNATSTCAGWEYSAAYNNGGSNQNGSDNRLVVVDG